MPPVLFEHPFQASLQSNMTMIAEWASLPMGLRGSCSLGAV